MDICSHLFICWTKIIIMIKLDAATFYLKHELENPGKSNEDP